MYQYNGLIPKWSLAIKIIFFASLKIRKANIGTNLVVLTNLIASVFGYVMACIFCDSGMFSSMSQGPTINWQDKDRTNYFLPICPWDQIIFDKKGALLVIHSFSTSCILTTWKDYIIKASELLGKKEAVLDCSAGVSALFVSN